MVAVGRSDGLFVTALTQIEMCGKSHGPCPAEIARHIKHVAITATVRQRMQLRRDPKEKKNKINLPRVVILKVITASEIKE